MCGRLLQPAIIGDARRAPYDAKSARYRRHVGRGLRVFDHGCFDEAPVAALWRVRDSVPALRSLDRVSAAAHRAHELVAFVAPGKSPAAPGARWTWDWHARLVRVCRAPPVDGGGLHSVSVRAAARDRALRAAPRRARVNATLDHHHRGAWRRTYYA